MPFSSLVTDYKTPPNVWDEMCDQQAIRNHYEVFLHSLKNDSIVELAKKNELNKKNIHQSGNHLYGV
jgi:uncharacterized circularly permuted ATP-grasp superfamily protein